MNERKVREGLTMLDVDANVRPCPIEGTRFRPELKREGGKEQVPFLIVCQFTFFVFLNFI